jgi:CheY-like chemotaxis protein
MNSAVVLALSGLAKPSLRGASIAFLGAIRNIATLHAGARYCRAGMVGASRTPGSRTLDRTLVSIVDDDQPFRESMRKLVTLLGYTVEVFQSAADFLESHLLSETACLVTDVHMPRMSGVELHGHLVKLGYAIPTILVTAYPDDLVRDRALKDGVVFYLSKPVDDRYLEQCLRSALEPRKPIEGSS